MLSIEQMEIICEQINAENASEFVEFLITSYASNTERVGGLLSLIPKLAEKQLDISRERIYEYSTACDLLINERCLYPISKRKTKSKEEYNPNFPTLFYTCKAKFPLGNCENGSKGDKAFFHEFIEVVKSKAGFDMWCEGLDYEEWCEKHDYDEETMNYLHGNCDKWVNDHYQNGDKCVAILEEREDVETICLMHSCLLRNGKYVDVRGETKDFYKVIEAFDYGEFEIMEYATLEEFNEPMNELGLRQINDFNSKLDEINEMIKSGVLSVDFEKLEQRIFDKTVIRQ